MQYSPLSAARDEKEVTQDGDRSETAVRGASGQGQGGQARTRQAEGETHSLRRGACPCFWQQGKGHIDLHMPLWLLTERLGLPARLPLTQLSFTPIFAEPVFHWRSSPCSTLLRKESLSVE